MAFYSHTVGSHPTYSNVLLPIELLDQFPETYAPSKISYLKMHSRNSLAAFMDAHRRSLPSTNPSSGSLVVLPILVKPQPLQVGRVALVQAKLNLTNLNVPAVEYHSSLLRGHCKLEAFLVKIHSWYRPRTKTLRVSIILPDRTPFLA